MVRSGGGKRKMMVTLVELFVVVCVVTVGWSAKVEMQHLNDKNFTIHCDSRYYQEPSCMDSPSGYQCLCGDGFEYNKEGMCIAVSTNSRLEFTGGKKAQYAILIGKPFRALDAFTVTFWIKVKKQFSTGYIVSYSVRDHPNIFYLMLKERYLHIKMYNESMDAAPILKDEKDEHIWRHVAFSWDSKGGKYIVYVNGNSVKKGSHFGSGLLLPASGETTLGARSQHYAKEKTLWGSDDRTAAQALQMDLSHFHIWFNVLNSRDVRMIMKDCPLKYCGTAIRWTDFRDGTRGALKLRWPSGVYNRCFGEWMDDEVTCDRYCSVIKGARCREEMIENVKWPRTEATQNVSVVCPGKESDNVTKHATRMCHITPAPVNKGKWDAPRVDSCLDNITKRLLERADQISTNKHISYDTIFPFLSLLVTSTQPSASHTPNDLAGYIKVAELILEFQEDRIRNRNWLVDRWQNEQSTKLYPNSSDVKTFMNQYMNVFDNLLPGGGNEHAWNLTKPFGQSLVHLLNIMVKFVDIHAGVLLRDVVVERSSANAANFSVVKSKLAINMEVHFSNHSSTLRYPKDEQSGFQLFNGFSETKAIIKQKVWGHESSLAKKRAFVVTTLFISNVSHFLPNPYSEHKKLDDNLNSALYLIRFFPEDPVPLKPRYIVTTFSYISTKNISDSQCFRLQYEKIRKGFVWKFSKQDCVRVHHTISRAMCTCNDSGYFYGVTTDMYDPNWVEEKIVIYFMNWATYFGCAMSALCSLLGFCILVFLRTSSNTSTLHKNTSLAVGFAQLSLMCGIDLHEFLIPCRIFTLATVYFILCLFCWMMNQAFHIYSYVTYSAHNNDEVENGSVFKFMIMGWVVPIVPVLVGALSKGDKFYNKNACFVSWDWFIIVGGPGVGVVFVTLLMKGIALKEYLQSSYSLSEKGNKLVVNYMKAGRSQWGTILAMYCCLLVALRLHSTVLKFLFAIFSILQGSSLLCFSVLMNDEVRSMWISSYEGHKDKEEPDILDEIHELQHQQALAIHHQRSIDKTSHDRLSHDKDGTSFRGTSFDHAHLHATHHHPHPHRGSTTPNHSRPPSPERHRPGEGPGPLSSLFAPVLELAHGVMPHFGRGGDMPRDAMNENTDVNIFEDTAMMDTAI